jgi:hypothetical protein
MNLKSALLLIFVAGGSSIILYGIVQ